MSICFKNSLLVKLSFILHLCFLSVAAQANNVEISEGVSEEVIKFKYRQGRCGKKLTEQHVYLNNTYEEILRVTVRIHIDGRRFDRLKSYYIQPKGEVKIGCSHAFYKNNGSIYYNIEKIKLVNS